VTMNPTTTSPTTDARVTISYNAEIRKCNVEGGAWILTIRNINGESNFAFVSYRHAHKYLSAWVGKGRIRMVREGDNFTYSWSEAWKG
jgi:hypothetical protein